MGVVSEQSDEGTKVERVPSMFSAGTILLGKYRIEGELGIGGYGFVLRARDLRLDNEVAIKILKLGGVEPGDARMRFLREARAVAQLDSPHVVRVFDVGTLDDGTPYIVMELLKGTDLATLSERGAIDPKLAIDYVLQAAEALAQAHALGIIHRDVKPGNLFVADHAGVRVVKVLDFGISKTPTPDGSLTLTRSATILGTPRYMSPEQMRSSHDVDVRSDIWALGVVLYELVEARPPFAADNFAELCVAIATGRAAPMTIAPALWPVIDRCLQKEPGGRFANVAAFAVALGTLDPRPETHARIHRICRLLAYDGRSTMRLHAAASRSRSVAALVAAIAVVVAAIALVLVRRSTEPPAKLPPAPPVTLPVAPPPPSPPPAQVVSPPPAPAPPVQEPAPVIAGSAHVDKPVAHVHRPTAAPSKVGSASASPQPHAAGSGCDPWGFGGC
jgi:serine/threonine protein kinase